MTVSQAFLNSYRRELSAQSDAAKAYVQAYLDAFRKEYPDMSMGEVRDCAIEAIQGSLAIYGDKASDIAGQMFEELGEREGKSVTSVIYDVISDEEMDKKVRYFARKLVDGDVEGFDRSVADITAYYVKRSAFENMRLNCEANKVKYARVPSGRETCGFCFMLSSRGFVYMSKKTAGEGHAYHRNCDCIIVPGFEDADEDTQIEQYEPGRMRSRYAACADTLGVDTRQERTLDEESVRAIVGEIETRDPRWLFAGNKPEPTFETEALKEEVENRRKWELATAKRLNEHGVRTDFVTDRETIGEGADGLIYAGLADFANGAEIKTLSGASSFNTVDGYIKNTSSKKNAVRLYFDNSGNASLTDEKLAEYVKRSRRFKRGSIYMIDHGQNLVKIR